MYWSSAARGAIEMNAWKPQSVINKLIKKLFINKTNLDSNQQGAVLGLPRFVCLAVGFYSRYPTGPV